MSAVLVRWMRSKKTQKKNTIQVTPDSLQEGRSYLLRVTSGAHIALFEGIHEDLYSFLLLRGISGYTNGSMRWVNTRYLVDDFDAFIAFDELSNPLIELWYQLGISVGQRLPIEWFVMFEEASRKEREAAADGSSDKAGSSEKQAAISPAGTTQRPHRIGKADVKRTRRRLFAARHHGSELLADRKGSGLSSVKEISKDT